MTNELTDHQPSASPQSVARIVGILETLCARSRPTSLADLSRALDSPKSSLAALLRGLEAAELVEGEGGSWRLAAGAFGLGSALVEARRRHQSSDMVRDGMRRLAERSGETVLFAVSDENGETLTYVEIVESRNAIRFAVAQGDRRPLYCTAAGRALLAAMPEQKVTDSLAKLKTEAFTAATVTDKRQLAEIIKASRALGVAQTIDQTSRGVVGTAAVIRDASARVLGALVVAAPNSTMSHSREALIELVREEAERTSRSLGYREPA